MTVSVFTSRVILDVLGVEDFGIYNIVGGFVAMFSLLSGTLTAASQRFMSYELGRAKSDISKVFSTSLSIHLMLAALIFILLESAGVWFLNYKMNIAPDRLVAANWVFQCSILTFCVNLISIPYNASIIAYEKMTVFAYISVFEAVAKLGIVYLLLLFNFDKLILYAFLTLLVAIVLRCVYGLYCRYKFRECRFYFIKDKELYREMLGFSGWNFIGSSANVLNSHGINILINIFFGVALNAARGIAEQINTTLNSFVLNFMMALNPQITKNFASGDYDNMNVLIIKGAKYSFFLFWLLSLPILLETDIVLKIWLVQVPEYTSILVRYALIYTMCQILSQTLYAAMLATGKIKEYQIIVGTLSLMAFPTAYIFFFLGLPAQYGYISSILFSLFCLLARMYLLRRMVPNFSWYIYFKEVICRIVLVVVLSIILLLILRSFMCLGGIAMLISTILSSLFFSIICIYFVGLNISERQFILAVVRKSIKKRF